MEAVLLEQNCFAFGDLLLRSTKSKQKCLLSAWPDFVGFPHSDDAPWAQVAIGGV